MTTAIDLQKRLDEISRRLDLLQPRQVETIAAQVYRGKVKPVIRKALEDFKDRQTSEV